MCLCLLGPPPPKRNEEGGVPVGCPQKNDAKGAHGSVFLGIVLVLGAVSWETKGEATILGREKHPYVWANYNEVTFGGGRAAWVLRHPWV